MNSLSTFRMKELGVLEKELELYESKKSDLLDHVGEFALVCGTELTVHPDYEAALKEGYRKCPDAPFLIKSIREKDETLFFTRNLDLRSC